MKWTASAKLALAAIVLSLVAVLGWLLAQIFDWDLELDQGGPEYVQIRWIIIPAQPHKPWFPWLHK